MSTNNSLLPREAVALVQHIELNKAGWWDKAVNRLVMAAVWLANEPPSVDAIQAALKGTFKLSLTTPKLNLAITWLESRKMLLRLPGDTYRIPDEQRAVFEKEIASSEAVDTKAKESFCKLVNDADAGLDPEQVWRTFEHDFLGPLIKQVGVNAYRLVAGEKLALDPALVDYFLQPFPQDTHSKLRALVTSFIDPKKPEVRAFISRMLHARFCVEASGLRGWFGWYSSRRMKARAAFMPPDYHTPWTTPVQPKIISFGFSYCPGTGGFSFCPPA